MRTSYKLLKIFYCLATTLQALSVWIICAFSIHRSRSIIKRSIFFSESAKNKVSINTRICRFLRIVLNKITLNKFKLNSNIQAKPNFNLDEDEDDDEYENSNDNHAKENNTTNIISNETKKKYFFHINLKNNFNYEAYEVKFYKKPLNVYSDFANLFKENTSIDKSYCFCCCFCTFKPKLKSRENSLSQNEDYKINLNQTSHQTNELTSSRNTIFVLYMLAILYLIPQMFEKKLIKMHIDGIHYIFLSVTEFGETRFFRQLFHLWFYLIFVYVTPFLLIFIFNLLLHRAFLDSKKRCQRYKLKLDPSIILKVTIAIKT